MDAMISSHYEFGGKVKIYSSGSSGSWHFVDVPKNISEEIHFFSSPVKRGWGSVRVRVHLGNSHWSTSIFYDSKAGLYMLPLKSEIRKAEKLVDGSEVELSIDLV